MNLQNAKIVFCDLDGVLANFEKEVEKICGKPPNDLKSSIMWRTINSTPSFFENLEWMPDAKELWENIKQYDPIILTGIPNENKQIERQKKKWCERELGANIRVITCKTSEKPHYCTKGSILIDDRTINQEEWIKNGGVFIHHLSTKETLTALQ